MTIKIPWPEEVSQKNWLCKLKINAVLPDFGRISSLPTTYSKAMPKKIEEGLIK
jgi:hypothetical protein